ncbi:MAG: ABC transporter ATP-binding protein [Acidobacteriota bacterium]|nr:ABC transporter ATP-binding protein [Acidobacteriota bacterium]
MVDSDIGPVPALEVRGVSKRYPGWRRDLAEVRVLGEVSLQVAESEFFVLVGPSGCGKSTLLRLIAGLDTPSGGEVHLAGDRVVKTSPEAIVVWQEFALLDWRTVEGNILFGLEVNRISKSRRLELADHYIELMGLTPFRHNFPSEISGGMKQRVGLARALALDPPLLLMDEPFGALDAQTRMIMQEELLRIWEGSEKTVLFVTHSLEEAILLGDRIGVFSAGPDARIKEIVDVNLPRPRLPTVRASADYTRVYDRLYQILREEVVKTISREATSGRP